MKFSTTTIIAVIALVVGVFSMLYQRRSVIAATGDGQPFNFGGGGSPVFNFGSRTIGGTSPPALPSGMAGCGCGGSYGDYAVAKLNPIFGETQPILPYTSKPQINDPQLPVIGNGAMIQ